MHTLRQGRTQEYFPGGGGQDYLKYSRENASEGAAKRPERGGGGMWEGGFPPPTRGSFCIFEIEIEVQRSGAHFGWILGGGKIFE